MDFNNIVEGSIRQERSVSISTTPDKVLKYRHTYLACHTYVPLATGLHVCTPGGRCRVCASLGDGAACVYPWETVPRVCPWGTVPCVCAPETVPRVCAPGRRYRV